MGVTNRRLTQPEVDQLTHDAHITIAEQIKSADDAIQRWYDYAMATNLHLRASTIDHLEYAADQCDEASRLLRVLVADLRTPPPP